MQEIRRLFHAINNELHKATIHAGVLRHNAAHSPGSDVAPSQTEAPIIKNLMTIENSVLNAGKLLDQMKDIVYKELGIETKDPPE